VYLNGDLRASATHSKSLSDVSDTFAYLGKSLVSVDPNFNGAMDEFRIYDHALDGSQVAASFADGPTPQSGLRLEVNTVTGSVAIAVYDAGGRRVRVLHARGLAPGRHHVQWDVRDAGGRRVAPGVYFARVRMSHDEGEVSETRRLVVVPR